MTSLAKACLLCAVAGVIGLASFPFFGALLHESVANPYAGHVIYVPILAAILLWNDQRGLSRSNGRQAGAVLTVAALGLLAIGWRSGNITLMVLTAVAAVVGGWLWAYGVAGLRQAWFPLTFLLLMTPPPRGIGAVIAPPMQEFVATSSMLFLKVLSVPVTQHGVLLRLPEITLEVAEECAGLRFLPILFVLVGTFARIVLPTTRAQLALMSLAIPVAILANVVRVTVTGAGAYLIGTHVATGPLHYYIGKGMWAVALLGMISLAWPLRRWSEREVAAPGDAVMASAP